MKKRLIALAAAVAVIALSCSKQSEEAQTPEPQNPGSGTTCDTVNRKYATNVVPILSAHCYSCHGASSSSGSNGILLEGYGNLKARADNGQLIGVITHAAGFPPMPQGFPKLSDCDINIIRSWINNGTQNN